MRVALTLLLMCLPGFAWWTWRGNREKDPVEAAGSILGVSFSLVALGALFFYTIRVEVTPLLLGLLLGVCLGAVLAGLIRRRGAFSWYWLLALFGFGVVIAWRLWQARELIMPNWVDSQHHVLIIRKIIEARGLPSTLEPYLPGPFYYHFGFHALAALFSVLSGLDPAQSTLIFGQIISAGISLGVYSLVKSLSKDWRAALLAALAVTFATKMPGYYLTWGRYTLLVGVLLLTLAMAEIVRARQRHDSWWQLVELTLLTAGTLLSHYLGAFLLALFFVIYGAEWLIKSIRAKNWDWKWILSLAAPALVGLLFASRWYLRIWKYSIMHDKGITVPAHGLAWNADLWEYLSFLVGPASGYTLAILAIIGLGWALTKSRWVKFGAWAALLMVLALPFGLEIFSFRSDYFGLVVFIPVAVLSAGLAVDLTAQVKPTKKTRTTLGVVFGVACLVLAGWGGWLNRDVVNDTTVLVTEADMHALEWVETHLPEDARFFVNTVGWGYGVYRGVDGGGWLLPETGRWSLAPTTFYPYGADPATNELWTAWGTRASTVNSCGTEFWELVAEADLDYVYTRQGTTGLQAETLAACEGLRQLFSNGSVSIWLIEMPLAGENL